MITTAVRIYGKNDLRLERFELPPINTDEILAKVVSDSICMSSYKAAIQGPDHKRVPDNVAQNPTIIGHEFCGEILEVGSQWKDKFSPGDKYTLQPAHNKNGSMTAPGYSYSYCGGDATYVIIPPEIMEMDCLLKFDADAFFLGSLAEPMSCITGTYHAMYHTVQGSYVHHMGIRKGGKMAILAGAGPMGLGAVDYALHNPDVKPSLLVVTDVDEVRLKRAMELFKPDDARSKGVRLVYVNTESEGAIEKLKTLAKGTGYDDVFVMAPVRAVIKQGDAILGKDGCLNFFAGPPDPDFKGEFNFYNVHYSGTHIVGTSGGNNDDMRESLDLMSKGFINPSAMVTHIGGLDCVIETTLNLPAIPGGKKLIYTAISMPLTAIADFEKKGKTDPLFAALDRAVKRTNNLWNAQAEKYLLNNAKSIY
ncbi:MAG: zinc-binding dehydrogenase [Spirochaetales bacterium]|nr:zinc-binding dehydrogenase [Spirochaetales bacterium]